MACRQREVKWRVSPLTPGKSNRCHPDRHSANRQESGWLDRVERSLYRRHSCRIGRRARQCTAQRLIGEREGTRKPPTGKASRRGPTVTSIMVKGTCLVTLCVLRTKVPVKHGSDYDVCSAMLQIGLYYMTEHRV